MDSLSADADAWHAPLTRGLFAFLVFCVTAKVAFGDGGALILHQQAGSLSISVFASPSPLRAGRVDLSVLLQNRGTDDVLLDAAIQLELEKPGESSVTSRPTPGGATNRLLYATAVDIAQPGEWSLTVRSRYRGREMAVQGTINVLPSEPVLLNRWPYFAVVPIAIFLFLLNQHLKSSRRAARLPGRP